MATFSEIAITFNDFFEVNTGANLTSIVYLNNVLQSVEFFNEKIVTTRSQAGEFSVGTDATTQAQKYKDALDLDLLPLADWEVSIVGATVTIKSTLDYIQFSEAYAGRPNDDKILVEINNFTVSSDRSTGILTARSNYYATKNVNNPLITQQSFKLWFYDDLVLPDFTVNNPNYEATQLRPSVNWEAFDFAISQYARDFIKPRLPIIADGLQSSAQGSVITSSVTTRNNLEVNDQPLINQIVTTLGYSTYSQGAQHVYTKDILLTSTRHQVKPDGMIVVPVSVDGSLTNVFLRDDEGTILVGRSLVLSDNVVDAIKYAIFDLSLLNLGNAQYLTVNDTYRFELIDECIYKTETVYFLNRYGVFQGFTFFKAEKESVNITRNGTYKNNFVFSGAYDTERHLYQSNGTNGDTTLRLTSGYIHEDQNATIEEMLLSDYIFLADRTPIDIDTKSLEKKTRLVDKLISYDITFKKSSDLIQTI